MNTVLMEQGSAEVDFFTEYGEGSRYRIEEVIGKGSYGVVCSAFDTHTGEKVAIKKINDIFEHVSDATRILREIKLLRQETKDDLIYVQIFFLSFLLQVFSFYIKTIQAAAPPRHCGDKAHPAAGIAAGVQGHLCGV